MAIDEPYNLPSDWENPKWDEYDKIHGWRNYASDEIKLEWGNFTDHQKKILAMSFNDTASNEHWD